MRFLADESCDFAVVRALRSAGHDVIAVVEISPRADDEIVIDRAVREDRILLTEDKDFGQLVYANKRPSGGVLFIRFPARARRSLPQTVVDLVRQRGERLIGDFVVVQPGRIRVGRRYEKK
jgi:predicted nuclease of predicted toxin-antitoxin system